MGSQQAQTHGQLGKLVGLAGCFVVPIKERRIKKGGDVQGIAEVLVRSVRKASDNRSRKLSEM